MTRQPHELDPAYEAAWSALREAARAYRNVNDADLPAQDRVFDEAVRAFNRALTLLILRFYELAAARVSRKPFEA